MMALGALIGGHDARAQNVEAGIWYDPSNTGWGLAIDQQDNAMTVIGYTYYTDGTPVWFYTANTMTSKTSFTGSMNVYRSGQLYENYGPVTLTFNPAFSNAVATTGTITMLGSTASIERFNFALGSVPQLMLGSWVLYFVNPQNYNTANRYDFTQTGYTVTNGSGTYIDQSHNAIGACYYAGSLAPWCVIIEFTNASATTVAHFFYFDPHIINTITGMYEAGGTGSPSQCWGWRLAAPSTTPFGSASAAGTGAATVASAGTRLGNLLPLLPLVASGKMQPAASTTATSAQTDPSARPLSDRPQADTATRAELARIFLAAITNQADTQSPAAAATAPSAQNQR